MTGKRGLPYKVRLSGADCFHLVLDKHAKKHGAGGNVMRKVFFFNSRIDHKKIGQVLKRSDVINWLCNIRLRTPLFRIPYWQYTAGGKEIVLTQHDEPDEKQIPRSILERDITIKASRFVEADIIYYPSGNSAFILSWNHILLDAKGTVLLFDHLNQLTENINFEQADLFPAEEKKAGFISYIRNMYEIKSFIQTSSRSPVSSIALKNIRNEKDNNSIFKIISFNKEQTKHIHEKAFKGGSKFGPTLYYIACCAHAVNAINTQRNNAGDLWLPVPYDGRLRGAKGPMISNSVSFLFYRIGKNELDSVGDTIKSLSAQMTAQVKDKISAKYTRFLNMMRHVPLWLYYFLISRTGKGTFASFLYTTTGDNFNQLKYLFGVPVQDIQMKMALTYPPGFTIVFLQHDDRLNIDIASSPGVINNNELHLFEEKIKELLLA